MKTLLLLILTALPLCAQVPTIVTGTITDSNGNIYANGTVAAYSAGTGPSISSGPNPINSAGFFSVPLVPNTWIFTICAPPVSLGPLTANLPPARACFQSPPIIISGATQDLSSTLNAIAVPVGPNWSLMTPIFPSFSVTGNVSVGGTLGAKQINNVRYVDSVNSQGWAGADLGAWINAAAVSAGVTGRVIVSPSANGVFPNITTPLVLPRGLVLNLPPGVFNIVSGNVVSNDGVQISGSGMASTTLVPTSATGDVFTFTGASFSIGNMTVNPSVLRTAGAFANIQTSQGILHEITIQDMFDGFVQGPGASTSTFRNIIALGGGGNWHNVFRNGPLTSGTIPGTYIENFVIALSAGGSTISGALFVLDSGTDSTKIHGLEISRTAGADANFGIQVLKSAAAQAPSFITMVNSYCETTSTNVCVEIDSANHFSSETFGLALGLIPLKITGGRGISIQNGFIALAQQGGISITGGIGIDIIGVKISDDAGAAANTYDGISVAAGVTDFRIIGNLIGNVVFSGNTFRNGITVAAGASDKYIISGNVIDGFGTTAVSDGGTGVNKTVQQMGGGLTGYGTASGANASLIAEGAGGNASTLEMFNNSANADSKWWEMIGLAGTGTLIFRTLNDALNVQVPWLTVTRSGQSPLLAAFGVPVSATAYQSATNCAAVGTAASPSVAACASAAAGSFSCATNATGATCQVTTTAVTANSQIFVTEDETLGARLGVTCNTGTTVIPTSRLLASRVGGASFTINLGTVTTNPACFSYHIVN